MKVKVLCITALFSLLGTYALASEPIQPQVAESPNLQVEMWLKLQREGNAASKKVQTATPAERELAMQRLLKSYEHAIPEYYGESEGGQFKR